MRASVFNLPGVKPLTCEGVLVPAFTTPEAGDTAVIACHFNPCGFMRPRLNLLHFLSWTAALGIPVYVAELSFTRGRPPVLPAGPRVRHIETDPVNCLFQKEALLNAAAAIVPGRFTKIAWLDADILISDNDWLAKASALLDDFAVIQPFRRGILTNPDWREEKLLVSVAAGLHAGGHFRHYHPGFAWAGRREFFTDHGGLYERSIAGHGDIMAARAFTGSMSGHDATEENMNQLAVKEWREWAAPVTRWTGGKVGYLRADAWHLWHGETANRNYDAKRKLLRDVKPCHVENTRGCLEWTAAAHEEIPDTIKSIAATFSARREDTPAAIAA